MRLRDCRDYPDFMIYDDEMERADALYPPAPQPAPIGIESVHETHVRHVMYAEGVARSEAECIAARRVAAERSRLRRLAELNETDPDAAAREAEAHERMEEGS